MVQIMKMNTESMYGATVVYKILSTIHKQKKKKIIHHRTNALALPNDLGELFTKNPLLKDHFGAVTFV